MNRQPDRAGEEPVVPSEDEAEARSGDAQTTARHGQDRTSDALQSFAHAIQEKAGPVSRTDERGAGRDQPGTGLADEPKIAVILHRVRSVLQTQPLLGIVLGLVLGFLLGRASK